MPSITRSILLLGILASAACSTMSKNECLNADWRALGFEDGSRGYHVSRVGEHRKACAEYQVKPDLEAYRDGYHEGVRRYCRPPIGYRLGLRGGQYGGICPGDLEHPFVEAYDYGKDIYLLKRDLSSVNHRLHEAQQALYQVEDDIDHTEQHLVAPHVDPVQRLQLLRDLKRLHGEKADLQDEIHDLQDHGDELGGNIEQLVYESPYR
jgi:hypothetical protein